MLESSRYILEQKGKSIKHFLYASSSSVYGNNKKTPYSTVDMTDKPVSLYAATKKADELIAYSYSKLFGIPMTGMRFFTVYGPAGRPDMAYYSFTDKLVNGEKIKLYNHGNNKRDFTYIDDVITAITELMKCNPETDENGTQHCLYNIGNHQPVDVLSFVKKLENALITVGVLERSTDIDKMYEGVDKQPGDVEVTYAYVKDLEMRTGYKPVTKLNKGLIHFAEWYRDYYLLNT